MYKYLFTEVLVYLYDQGAKIAFIVPCGQPSVCLSVCPSCEDHNFRNMQLGVQCSSNLSILWHLRTSMKVKIVSHFYYLRFGNLILYPHRPSYFSHILCVMFRHFLRGLLDYYSSLNVHCYNNNSTYIKDTYLVKHYTIQGLQPYLHYHLIIILSVFPPVPLSVVCR